MSDWIAKVILVLIAIWIVYMFGKIAGWSEMKELRAIETMIHDRMHIERCLQANLRASATEPLEVYCGKKVIIEGSLQMVASYAEKIDAMLAAVQEADDARAHLAKKG